MIGVKKVAKNTIKNIPRIKMKHIWNYQNNNQKFETWYQNLITEEIKELKRLTKVSLEHALRN